MSGAEFVHLHLHSQYSLLDGAIKLKNLFPALKELGMDTVAVTDHGNMFGVVDFHKQAKAAGVNPIFGCEVYVAGPRGRKDRSARESYHLVLLARNAEGYRNLSYLVSMAYIEGFYYEPRIDRDLLRGHSKGLIGMTACLGGEVNQALLSGDNDRAVRTARELRGVFEPGCFFIEIMRTGLPEQEQVIPRLRQIAEDLGTDIVATNDCHYLRPEDARAHDILLCIQTGKDINDRDRLRHATNGYYLRSGEEMARLFADCPEAIGNTRRIAEMCTLKLDFKDTFLPRFKVPDGFDVDSYFERVAREGFEAHKAGFGLHAPEQVYRDRLDYEIAMIKKMGFSSYFLIVWDFVRFAKNGGIPVGPGRGSGAGSLVAYSLSITDLDPIRYGLLFERFLNPERVSMPDIDMDFCMNRRDEVIRYVKEKYGDNNVGQIVTFSQLLAKSVIKDVCRVLGLPFDQINRLTRNIPGQINQKPVTVDKAIEIEPRLKQLAEENAAFAEVIEIARTLEGLNRQTGMHAAGVVIAEKPLWDLVPVCRGTKGEVLTQFSMKDAETAGLVKFDFLGLKTLTLIDNAVRMINADRGGVDISRIPLDDPEVFALFSRADTDGVFQSESGGFKEMLARLKPARFEEVVCAVALYRPGPLDAGLVEDYINRKHGRAPVTYPHPCLEPALKETFGVIVYQEQVMEISRLLSGFSMGKADILRSAMGKKKEDVMAAMKPEFVEGANTCSGMPVAAAEGLWEKIKTFAGYAFNKSHAAAYALIAYQTAWLKAHHPVHFMAALLSSEMGDQETVVNYIQAARRMGIKVLQPDVNESGVDFTVRGGQIRFGLLAVRGIGEAAVDEILKTRRQGPFWSLFDFCNRVDLGKANKKSIEALVKGGAFDFSGAPRAAMMSALDRAVEAGQSARRSRRMGQVSLFGADEFGGAGELAGVAEWDEKTRLGAEKDALGFYVSGHPMEKFAAEMKRYAPTSVVEAKALAGPCDVSVGGIVVRLEVKVAKSGEGKFAIAAVEDLSGQIEVMVPPRVFAQSEAALRGYEPVLIRGFLSPETVEEGEGEGVFKRRSSRFRVQQIISLGELRKRTVEFVTIHLPMNSLAGDSARRLRKVLEAHPGPCAVRLDVTDRETGARTLIEAGPDLKVAPDDALVTDLAFQFPGINVSLG
jgi:DNA polymerase-3 subunit alpha